MAINPALKQLMAQKANKYKGATGNAKKLKEGRNVVRIVAPKPSDAEWVKEEMDISRDLGVHWIKPNLDSNTKPLAVVGSEEICYDRPSAIAAAVEAAIANCYDEDAKKVYESWRARATVLVNMVDRADNTVGPWELPKGVWGSIMGLWNLYAEQDFDIFDHTAGLDLAITRTGTGLNTKYDVQVMALAPGKMFTPVSADQAAKAEDLDEFIKTNFFRNEEQKALNAIAQISGIVIPRIGAPATPTAALTSQAAVVPGATVQPAAQVDPAVMAAQEQARMMALIAAQQQQLAQQPAAPQPEVIAPQVSAQTGLSDLSQEQQDDLLRQLAAIGS